MPINVKSVYVCMSVGFAFQAKLRSEAFELQMPYTWEETVSSSSRSRPTDISTHTPNASIGVSAANAAAGTAAATQRR